MYKRIKLFLLLIYLFTLTGCWDQNIYDEIGFILQVGIEKGSTDNLLITITSPVIGSQRPNQVELLQVNTNNIRASREAARLISTKTLEAGKIQQILISKEIAEKGISNIFDVYERDPSNPLLALIAIVDGSPNVMLKETSTDIDKPRVAFYINQLLKGSIKGSHAPETRVHDFNILNTAPGLDPMTPILSLGQNNIIIIGTALFHQDRMVGQIDQQESTLLLAMNNHLKRAVYIAQAKGLPKDKNNVTQGISLGSLQAKSKITSAVYDNIPYANIHLKLTGSIDEYILDAFDNPQDILKVEAELENEIEQKCNKIIRYLQEIGSDPLGIGERFRSRHNSFFEAVDWYEAYKNAEIHVDVDLNIDHYGVSK